MNSIAEGIICMLALFAHELAHYYYYRTFIPKVLNQRTLNNNMHAQIQGTAGKQQCFIHTKKKNNGIKIKYFVVVYITTQ